MEFDNEKHRNLVKNLLKQTLTVTGEEDIEMLHSFMLAVRNSTVKDKPSKKAE